MTTRRLGRRHRRVRCGYQFCWYLVPVGGDVTAAHTFISFFKKCARPITIRGLINPLTTPGEERTHSQQPYPVAHYWPSWHCQNRPTHCMRKYICSQLPLIMYHVVVWHTQTTEHFSNLTWVIRESRLRPSSKWIIAGLDTLAEHAEKSLCCSSIRLHIDTVGDNIHHTVEYIKLMAQQLADVVTIIEQHGTKCTVYVIIAPSDIIKSCWTQRNADTITHKIDRFFSQKLTIRFWHSMFRRTIHLQIWYSALHTQRHWNQHTVTEINSHPNFLCSNMATAYLVHLDY